MAYSPPISDTKRCAKCLFWQRFTYRSDSRYCDHLGMTGKRRQYKEDGWCLSFEAKQGTEKKKTVGICLRGSHIKRRSQTSETTKK